MPKLHVANHRSHSPHLRQNPRERKQPKIYNNGVQVQRAKMCSQVKVPYTNKGYIKKPALDMFSKKMKELMDQRALRILLNYSWLCIKGTTKSYGHFKVKQCYKCPINYCTPVKQVYNVSETLILFKNWIWNLKCVCRHLPLDLLRVLERSSMLKMLSKCDQIVAQCLSNKQRPRYPRSDGGCLRYLTRFMTGQVFYLVKSLNNHICLPFMQHHLLDYFCISQKVLWSIVFQVDAIKKLNNQVEVVSSCLKRTIWLLKLHLTSLGLNG